MSRLPWALLGVVTLTAVISVSVVPTASAHDVLVSSNPADQATVARTPTEIVLTFDEPAIALGTRLVVTGPAGPAQQGAPRLVDKTVTQSLAPGSPAGAYTVDWRVTSVDGHPVSGVLTFTTSAAGAPGSAVPTAPVDSAPTTASSKPPAVWVWVVVGVVVLGLARGIVRARRRRQQDEVGDPDTTTRSTPKENL